MKNRDRIIENKGTFASLTDIIKQLHINMGRLSVGKMKTLLKHDEDVEFIPSPNLFYIWNNIIVLISRIPLIIKACQCLSLLSSPYFWVRRKLETESSCNPLKSLVTTMIKDDLLHHPILIWLQMYLHALHTTLHPRLLVLAIFCQKEQAKVQMHPSLNG